MMATSKKPTSATKCEVDCELCRHYSGSFLFNRFACAKGHAQESAWILKRFNGCGDYAQMTRDEQILKRFEHDAKWNGDQNIKKHRSEVRRMVTGIDNTLQKFGQMMTADQITAMREAAKHLKALGDDLEHACERAVRLLKQSQAERERQEKARRAALVAEFFGSMADVEILTFCEDLAVFDTSEGWEWLSSHKRLKDVLVGMEGDFDLRDRLRLHKQHRTPATWQALKEAAAVSAGSIKNPGYPRGPGYATWKDFETFRAWRQDVNATLQNIAKGGKTQ